MNIVVTYDGTDITDSILFGDATFTTAAMGVPGSCTFRVKDLTHTGLFIPGKELTLDIDGVRTWGGYVLQVHRGYFLDGTPNHCDPLVPMYYTVEGVDYNILLSKRVLYDKSDGRAALTQFPADTDDDVVIDYYVTNHTDLLSDGVTLDGVVHVGSPSTDDPIDGKPGETVLDFLRRMEFNVGAIFYIDPDKRLVYCDVDTPTAPYGISDNPGTGEIGCRDLQMDFDGSNLRNDALVWGAGQGSDSIHFKRTTDSTSVSSHGLWQVGLFSTAMFRQATIDRTANTYVYGSPQNKRGGKDDAVGLRCTIFQPGFRVAQKVSFSSDVFAFSDVIPIRRMTVTFVNPHQAKFELTISHEIDSPWIGFEFWFPPIPKITFQHPKIYVPPFPPVPTVPGSPGVTINECVGGRIEFIDGSTFGVGGNSYAFNNGAAGPYSMYVSLFAASDGAPYPAPSNYLGWDWYLVDGDINTIRFGYWAWARGEITWDLRIPLPVTGVSIDQGIGAPNDQDSHGRFGPFDGWRRMSDQVTLAYSNDGSSWVQVGDSGVLAGAPYNITVPANDGFGATARYWKATSIHSVAESQFDFFRGEYGWAWWVNGAQLFVRCVNLTDVQAGDVGVAPPTGPFPIPAPTGQDGTRCYYQFETKWIAGSMTVWADGLYVSPNIYIQNIDEMWISFPSQYCGAVIAARYLAQGT